ncbi:E3 ubiquitin-protein ligase RNF4 isoform X2 [Drosophila kikkawai]|uniref:E3 ubiquitin-protein ligase RNF4 isoform X2 n=1 Tax=Drosophila kikkawai TaxID=30033 RepID=A0A6P4HM98_DROKI|nr:E3 ubiquitin-protein ligase RNF4 isoform X2 [Drosophila kikkawai]
MSDSSFVESELSRTYNISTELSSPSASFGSSSSSSSHFPSDSIGSSSSSSHSPGASSSESVQDNSFRVTMDESRDQSTDLEGESDNQSADFVRESLNRSNDQIAQMLEDIGSITRYCEQLASQVDNNYDLTTTSTPTIIQGRRPRLDVTPVEVIDLSNFEFAPPARPPTNRTPDAVIDLCTPDRSSAHRRRSSQQSTSNAVVVDLDDPSPPKRTCPTSDESQMEESYKCPVCLENVRRREPVSTKCGHVFCKECLVAAINSVHKCPLCNKKMTVRQFSRIYL